MDIRTITTPTGTRLLVDAGAWNGSYSVDDGLSPLEAIEDHISIEEAAIQARQRAVERMRDIREALLSQGPLDLHKHGIYVVLDPSGAPILETCAETGYSARATFLRRANKRWSVSEAEGYRVAELKVSSQT